VRQRPCSCTKPTAIGRRYVIACDGERWTLDLFQHSEYDAEQQIDPQSANDIDEAKRMAQDWETELY
jgi:hypothetical protein